MKAIVTFCAILLPGAVLIGGVVLFHSVEPVIVQQVWPEDVPALRSEGDMLVESLETYRTNTGAYPEALADLGLGGTLDPGWEYEVTEDRQWFRLSIGDYARDGLSLSHASHKESWYLDR